MPIRLPEGGAEVRLAPGPGDHVLVPLFTPHHEENPTDDETVVVPARSSQGASPSTCPGR